MFRLFTYSWMRRQELISLHWADVDFKEGSIFARSGMQYDENKNWIIGDTKTEASKRNIPLNSETLLELKKLKLKSTSDRVFPYAINYPQNLINRIIEKYNFPKITIQGLRHTHCTLLIQSGANIKEVQERMGHSDIQTTLAIYTHTKKDKSDVV